MANQIVPGSDAHPRRMRRGRKNAAFLPSALAVMETPASPKPWLAAWTLMLIFSAVLAWSYFGFVDIVAIAQGRVTPKGYASVVQPLEAARITAIHVEEGSSVTAGQVMIELDAREYLAERDKLEEARIAALLSTLRLEALLAAGDDALPVLRRTEDVPEQRLALERNRAANEHQQLTASLRVLAQQRQEMTHQLAATTFQLRSSEVMLPLIDERLQAQRRMTKDGFASKIQLVELEQKYLESEFSVNSSRSKIDQTTAAIDGLADKTVQTIAEYRNRLYAELQDAKIRLVESQQQLVKVETRIEQTTVRAPVSGTVFQLQVNTVGGVVQASQQLAVVVPSSAEIVLEAALNNGDIGFVREGQSVHMKLDAYPFTRYGMFTGTVSRVSRDSSPQNQQETRGDPNAAAQARSPVVPRQYMIVVTPDSLTIDKNGEVLPMQIGMTASVEIRTGTRRVLDYFLSPLAASIDSAVRER